MWSPSLAAAAVKRQRKPRAWGFSVLEVLTALLIAAVLVSLALPAWQSQGYRIERSAALAGLLQASQCQARPSLARSLRPSLE